MNEMRTSLTQEPFLFIILIQELEYACCLNPFVVDKPSLPRCLVDDCHDDDDLQVYPEYNFSIALHEYDDLHCFVFLVLFFAVNETQQSLCFLTFL